MEKYGFNIEDRCEKDEYVIQQIEGGMPYMNDTRGLDDIRFLYNTHYNLVSPEDFPLRQEFINGTNEAYKLFEKGIKLAYSNDEKALMKMEESYKILNELTNLDENLSEILRLKESLILIEIKLLAGYYHLANKTEDVDEKIIKRMDELAGEEDFYPKMELNIESDQNKLSLFMETEKKLCTTGGMRILVE
ncbi:hypothetical protein ACFL1H_05660 [Nanoarchaeota archaeon]